MSTDEQTSNTPGALDIGFSGNPTLPTIVLCHGTMDRGAGMLRLSRRLDTDFHVIRYDRRGYGRSRGVGGPFTLDTHIADLTSIIEEHATNRRAAAVFGHSFGGNIALGVADRSPELVAAVAVYETPLSWLDWWPGTTAGGAAVASTDPADAAEAFMRRLIGDELWERLPASTRRERRSEGAAMMGELTDLRHQAPWSADRIAAPVLALHGEHGRPHHHKGMRVLARMLAESELVEVAEAGHGGPNSHATELAELLRSFVSRRAD